MTIEQYNNRRGVTLIELVMVIVIVGILAGVSSMYIKETVDLWRFLTFRNEVVSGGRMALARMAREIRQIRDSSSIEIAESSRLRFIAIDLDENGNDDTVEFFRNAANELRRIFNDNPASGDVLASGVEGLQFCYYKKDNGEVCNPICACNVPAGDLQNIYRIIIKMDITSGDQTKHLESQVYPRNL